MATVLFMLPFLCGVSFAQVFSAFLGEINSDDINVRSDSTVGSETVCILNKGDIVEVIAELYEWYKVRLPKNSHSYIKTSFLECINYKTSQPLAPSSTETKKDCLSAKLLRDRVNVRLHPNASSKILGVIDRNEVVNILGEEGEWSKIEPVANSFGYINKLFVSKAAVGKNLGIGRQGAGREAS